MASEAVVAEPVGGCSIVPGGSLPGLAAAGWEDVAFVVLDGGRERLVGALAGDLGAGNPHASLERSGILVVSPYRVDGNGLLLAGGSYSRVSLHVEADKPVVRKRLAVSESPSEDRELRQIQEIEWLTAAPAAVSELFAPIIATRHSETELELKLQFVPGYTLAELVFQRRLDGPGLAAALAHVYSLVSSTLWSRPPLTDAAARSAGYVQRIRRRIGDILASDYPADGVLRSFLQARTVVVDGRRCVGPRRLLEILGEQRWDPVVNPAGSTLCHGDLILEDILVSARAPHGFRLVDPNPANGNPLFDLAKTMMSLWLGYELIYFDLFAIAWRQGREAVEVEIELGAEEVQAVYRDAAERFVSFVEVELAHRLALPRNDLRSLLRMSAAIHMLAIVVFHLLHHGREQRALAFAATAMLHAQAALDARAPGPRA